MARSEERSDLFLPRVTVHRPAIDEHDRRTGTVILVVDPDGSPVFLSDFDIAQFGLMTSSGQRQPVAPENAFSGALIGWIQQPRLIGAGSFSG